MLNKKLEADALAEMSKLDNTNLSRDYSSVRDLTYIEKTLVIHGAAFIEEARANLEKANKIATGTLVKDISAGEIYQSGDRYEMTVGYPVTSEGAKYYDFVNKGVSGTQVKRNSPYSFKTPFANRKMALSIVGWLQTNKRAGIREDQTRKLSKLQKKRKSIIKMVSDAENKRRLAYAIASNIKKKGIKKTGFFDKALDSVFGESFANDIAKATGKEISVRIKSLDKNGNNSK